MGNLFSRLKKNLKHRLRGRKQESGRTGSSAAGERIDSSDSPPRPGPRVAVGGHDGKGNTTNTDVQQDHSRDRSPRPEPMPVGSNDDRQTRKADVDENEVSERHSHLDPRDVKAGHSQEAERVYPSPSKKPDSTRTFSFQLLYFSDRSFRQRRHLCRS